MKANTRTRTRATLTERVTRTRRPDGTYHVDGERDAGTATCPDCGGAIRLAQDVLEHEAFSGEIVAWGPAAGECEACGTTLVDTGWDGLRVLRLRATA